LSAGNEILVAQRQSPFLPSNECNPIISIVWYFGRFSLQSLSSFHFAFVCSSGECEHRSSDPSYRHSEVYLFIRNTL